MHAKQSEQVPLIDLSNSIGFNIISIEWQIYKQDGVVYCQAQ